MEYTIINDNNGLIANVMDAGIRTSAFVPVRTIMRDELASELQHIYARFNANSVKYRLDNEIVENSAFIEQHLPRMGSLLAGLQEKKRNAVARKIRIAEASPLDKSDSAYEQRFIGSLEAKELPERAVELTGPLNRAHTNALVRHGDLERLSDQAEIIRHVVEQHAIGRIIEIAGDKYPLRPSLDMPLPVGIDQEAARTAAANVWREIEDDIAAVDAAGVAWVSIVAFSAAASRQQPSDVFERALAR